ncbi:type II toxin-antitoxin system CcdA family antitoxin [Paraglaciecola aquimarina]|uniref:Type II toxin-antitoxin system CcdA family antitoxin n=1 Tax=Paraglaciecola algarum TaxID=3050085 RepID=A0ABS9DBS1_9ALTE|nr:type II toxin-antitoxin system CcdA family antitoxin [Paraglaciecola sp. G1-23]MCF2950164.1 type II toxin-antitoxin system CcdA family antitoxin [Paraglaciecola sp. G1-23]
MSVKAACNTTINRDLLSEAKALNIKLSPIFESALAVAVREEKKKKWFKENQRAIQDHNQQVSETGTFSESIGQLK